MATKGPTELFFGGYPWRDRRADGHSDEGLRDLPDGGAQTRARNPHLRLAARLLRDQPDLRLEHAPRPRARRGDHADRAGSRPQPGAELRGRALGRRALLGFGRDGFLGLLERLGAAPLESLDRPEDAAPRVLDERGL